MDLGAFVQENKRWLLAVAVGGVVWLVASAVLRSVHDAPPASPRALGASTSEIFDRAALDAALAEHEQLAAQRERLQRELEFVPGAKYQLPSGGRPDEALFRLGRELKQAIDVAANRRDVQFAESNVTWDLASGEDDIRSTLFGLELIDEIQRRLFAAHDAVRAADEDAPGLRAILALKLEPRRNQRQGRSTRPGEVDVRDFVTQEPVQVQFLADEPTLRTFFEALREPGRTLVVDSWKVVEPERRGEPCAVTGVLLGIQFKDAAAASTAAADGGVAPAPGRGSVARRN